MKPSIFIFLVVLGFMAFVSAICVGYYETKAYKAVPSKNSVSTEFYETHSYKAGLFEDEPSSKTNERFYQDMIDMERGSSKSFNGFPTCLTRILNIFNGDVIFSTETDTLSLLLRDLDPQGINRYPFYVITDNHGNIWTLFRFNDEYTLFRDDEVEYGFLLEEKVEEQDLE